MNRTQEEINKDIRDLKYELYKALPVKPEEELAIQKAEAKRIKYTSDNGLTIEKLQNAGFSVKVVHVRYMKLDGVPVPVPVPVFLRDVVSFAARGGATHILVEDTDSGEYVVASSICHERDNFDYKFGVKLALEQFSKDEASHILRTSTLPEKVTSLKPFEV